MQKVYQRINWENDPSTNTPINEDNLNKMDYALYELDKRVLTLGGYEERAALSATNAETSEINAKTSENNSKVSETNAKTSEINAKDYMERAYAATPEGYDELVETVRLMDIATTTESILEKSKPGGLKINHIKGATEQNGTPTPSSPIGIKNVGDCVEMISGSYSGSTGTYTTSAYSVCNKKAIPCNGGDIVKVALETTCAIAILWYGESGYISCKTATSVKELEVTMPSGATNFTFFASRDSGLTPDTVGKISLTVNGKYVTPIKSHGKNFVENKATTQTINGVVFTVNKDKSVTVKGTANANAIFNLNDIFSLEKGFDYYLNGCNDGATSTYSLLLGISTGGLVRNLNGDSLISSSAIGDYFDRLILQIVIASGITVDTTIYPMIRKADITDDTYEPYQETTAYIYTDEPIRDSDVVFNDNGVWKVERNVKEVVFDGSSDESWLPSYNRICIDMNDIKKTDEPISICSHFKNVKFATNTNDFFNYITGSLYFVVSEELQTLESWKTWLASNPISVQYKLATPTYETLNTTSQIALNSLETFDTVTYLEVDSRVQPSEIEVEYGTSKVGGYSLEALRNSKNNEKAIEENMKAITSGEVVVEYESEDDFAGRSWINVVTLMAGEKLKNILNMISAMFNNIRFLRNEVNKKMDANYGYLTEGDLNNIIYESGKAYCTTNVANIPIMGRGWLEVLMSDDADMVLQRYTTAVGNKVFIRRLVKSTSNGWGEWSKCNLTSDDIVVDMVAKPATMNLPAWASVSIEIESKYLSLEYELLSANVYFVDDLSSGTLSDSNLCVDQVMTSTNTASAHCCVAKVRNASSSQINKGCYSVARFVLVKK